MYNKMSFYRYTYSESNDFNTTVNISHLEETIKQDTNISSNLLGINNSNDYIHIIFQTQLSSSEEIYLDTIVNDYDYKESASNKNYDRQYVTTSTPTSTTASSFIDLDSMILSTKNLGENATYIITFNAEVSMSSKNKECEFRILVNNASSTDRSIRYSQPDKTSGQTDYNCVNLCCLVYNVSTNTEIIVQYKRLDSGSVAYVNRRSMIIDGVRNSEIV